jgi:hypothetical protein
MSLSSAQVYYLRRWLQNQNNPLLTHEISQLLDHSFLQAQIDHLPIAQQQHLANLINIHADLQHHRHATTSRQNLESQILGLLQITGKTNLTQVLPAQLDLVTWLTTFNQIGNLAQRYLGKVIVRNYWCGSKPISAWLSEFNVADSGEIHYKDNTSSTPTTLLHPEQEQYLKQWLSQFVNQCNRVLPKFSQMLAENSSCPNQS